MAIRIYAVAKDLNIERDELWDLCDKLNITVKGSSPLASISEEDAERIRKYLSSRKFDSSECSEQGVCQTGKQKKSGNAIKNETECQADRQGVSDPF